MAPTLPPIRLCHSRREGERGGSPWRLSVTWLYEGLLYDDGITTMFTPSAATVCPPIRAPQLRQLQGLHGSQAPRISSSGGGCSLSLQTHQNNCLKSWCIHLLSASRDGSKKRRLLNRWAIAGPLLDTSVGLLLRET